MTPGPLQAQVAALIVAGRVTACPDSLALWDQARTQAPGAWREMAQWVVAQRSGDLLQTLYQQTAVKDSAPLSEAMAAEVRALMAEQIER